MDLERTLGLTDSRTIYLARHLATFLLFFGAVVCFYKLGKDYVRSDILGVFGAALAWLVELHVSGRRGIRLRLRIGYRFAARRRWRVGVSRRGRRRHRRRRARTLDPRASRAEAAK